MGVTFFGFIVSDCRINQVIHFVISRQIFDSFHLLYQGQCKFKLLIYAIQTMKVYFGACKRGGHPATK